MTISLVQNAGASHFSAASQTQSFTSTPTAGNYAVVMISSKGGAAGLTTSVTDNQSGNTYNQIFNTHYTGGPGNCAIFIAQINGSSGTFTVTVNFGGTVSNSAIVIAEVNGISGTVDQFNVNNSGGAATSGSVTNGAQNANANAIVFAIYNGETADASATGLTDPPSSGYTSLGFFDGTSAYVGACDFGYKIVSALETSSASWTSTASMFNQTGIATFDAASAGTTVFPIRRIRRQILTTYYPA